jgi:hypothetical protein
LEKPNESQTDLGFDGDDSGHPVASTSKAQSWTSWLHLPAWGALKSETPPAPKETEHDRDLKEPDACVVNRMRKRPPQEPFGRIRRYRNYERV